MAGRATRNHNGFDLDGMAREFLTALCRVGAEEAKRSAPVDDGELRSKINYAIDDRAGGVVGMVRSQARHAHFPEYGTDPHYPPIEQMKRLSRKIAGDESLAYALQKSIGEQGTRRHPYMRPSWEVIMRVRRALALEKMRK